MWVSNQCCMLKIIGRTKVKQMCVLTTAESRVKIHPCGFSRYTFQGDGSVVVNSLFLIAPDVCGFLCLVHVFVRQYLLSFLIFSLWKRELVALLKLCSYCLVAVHVSMLCVFPRSAMGWSMVCDCGISSVSWPYTLCLAFLCYQ